MDKNETDRVTDHLRQCRLIVAHSSNALPVDRVVIRLLQITQDVLDRVPSAFLTISIDALKNSIKTYYDPFN